MAFIMEKHQDAPGSYIKLYKGNYILTVQTGTTGSYKYSVNRGASWYVVSDISGKIQINDSYLYVEDGINLAVFEMPATATIITK